MKRFVSLLLSLCLAALPLTGCGKGSGTADGTAEVRLCEVTHSVFYAPQYVAMALGYFAEEGITLSLTNGGGADKVMTAVLSGEADVGLAGPESCIYVQLEGREDAPQIFTQLTRCDGSFLVGREDVDFSWEMLRGKTVIGGRKGGVPAMTLAYTMEQNGIVPDTDAVLDTSVQFNMMAGAFTAGEGDYVTLFEPTASEVEASGQGYILCSVGEESGEIPYTAYFAAESYLAEHAETVQGFANAIAKGLRYIEEHSDAEVAALLVDQFPDTDLALLQKTVERHRSIGCWGSDGVMSEEALERLETVMEHAGELKARADFTGLVDNSFAEKAR